MAKYKWQHKRKAKGTFHDAINKTRTTILIENEVRNILDNFIGHTINNELLYVAQNSLRNKFAELEAKNIVGSPSITINEGSGSININFVYKISSPIERLNLMVQLDPNE